MTSVMFFCFLFQSGKKKRVNQSRRISKNSFSLYSVRFINFWFMSSTVNPFRNIILSINLATEISMKFNLYHFELSCSNKCKKMSIFLNVFKYMSNPMNVHDVVSNDLSKDKWREQTYIYTFFPIK